MSATHMGFQTDRRPLIPPVQPGHCYDTDMDMSLAIDNFSDTQLMVDPSLQAMDPVTRAPLGWQVYPGSWGQHSKDPSTSYLMLEQAPYFQDQYTSWQNRAEPAYVGHFGRHESPFSQHPTFSSGESLSPPTESDAFPSTPPDTSALPTFQQSLGNSDVWDENQIIFAGMGHAHETPSVNPFDVNPSQAATEGSVALSRSPSFGPEYGSKFNEQRSFTSSFEQEQTPRVEAEIRVYTPAESVYPDPDKDADLELEVSQDDKKDEDWTPKRKRRRSSDNKTSAASARPGARSSRTVRHVKKETDLPVAAAAPQRAALKAPAMGPACLTCNESFRDEATLSKHRKTKHLRPFTCVFHFAGCQSSFPSKNEWKRHVMTQHLALHYWLCTQGTCGNCAVPTPQSRRSIPGPTGVSSQLPKGAIFNRKDLYTQHVRRMHVPEEHIKANRSKKPTPDWEDQLRDLQAEAEQTRCQLPQHMKCPSTTCTQEFWGANAWDERMEHVAKHLDKASEGTELPLRFGGVGDPTLTLWAEKPEVGVVRRVGEGEWELVNMLRGVVGAAAPRKRRAEEEPEVEEDAEGEED